MPAPARVLIAAVVLGGAVALAVAISWMIPMDEPHAFALLLIAGAVGLGAQLVLTFPHAGELEHFSLEESVWIAALVLAPRGVATVGAVAGTVAWQYFRRTETHKIAFNAGQVAIAVLTAELTYGLIERRDPTDPIAWLMRRWRSRSARSSTPAPSRSSSRWCRASGLPRSARAVAHQRAVVARQRIGRAAGGDRVGRQPRGLALVGIPLGPLYVAYRGWMGRRSRTS